MDNSSLIKDNALTLIGRLTSPQEQRIWALIPALPRKWNLQGREVWSDLGNNCFQYHFEREDDLRRVLDNRPYHFAKWMVILQRWEPVISPSFPSLIPFWIKIKGLPIHYWHDDMVARVGQELGTLVMHELSRTTAGVRVLIDGLKPLVKESIVEFDSGEESRITLEYERLEMHCSYCNFLLHPRKNCPLKRRDEASNSRLHSTRSEEGEQRLSIEEIPSSYAPKEPPRSYNIQKKVSIQEGKSLQINIAEDEKFKSRVDRHGNTFGERIGTKQTRNPPPENTFSERGEDPHI